MVQNYSNGFGYMDFIIMVDDCNEEDEKKLRETLDDSSKEVFDQLTDIRRRIITTFSKLDKNQLEAVKRLSKGNYLVGLHDLNNLLSVFILISEKEN
ncbi:hypothetical protein IT412_05965 [Candidatus Peregrinibacteria bacterium]|nr:hypothetical protein [Candidatus Peregrinibacteria bacterium]